MDPLQALIDMARNTDCAYVKLSLGVYHGHGDKLDVRLAYVCTGLMVTGQGDTIEAAYTELLRKLATGEE